MYELGLEWEITFPYIRVKADSAQSDDLQAIMVA